MHRVTRRKELRQSHSLASVSSSHFARQVRAHSVIMATGASALRLNLPSEDQYWSKGISACAICDGEDSWSILGAGGFRYRTAKQR